MDRCPSIWRRVPRDFFYFHRQWYKDDPNLRASYSFPRALERFHDQPHPTHHRRCQVNIFVLPGNGMI